MGLHLPPGLPDEPGRLQVLIEPLHDRLLGPGRHLVVRHLARGALQLFAAAPRALSSALAQREAAQEVGLPAGETTTLEAEGVDKQSFIEDVRRALYASKLVSYAQGLDMLQAAGAQYGYLLV